MDIPQESVWWQEALCEKYTVSPLAIDPSRQSEMNVLLGVVC